VFVFLLMFGLMYKIHIYIRGSVFLVQISELGGLVIIQKRTWLQDSSPLPEEAKFGYKSESKVEKCRIPPFQ
jgi:hypothetical protein